MARNTLRRCAYCGNQIPRGRRVYCSVPCQVWSRTVILGENDCWLWTGGKSKGYGIIRDGGTSGSVLRTHRLAWEIFHGKSLGDDKLACHKCDVRSCNNPHHIFEGSYKDNAYDMIAKGRNRWVSRYGEDHASSKLKDADIISIVSDDRLQRVIAEDYGVSDATINRIKKRTRWKHIDVEENKIVRRPNLAVLTEDQVRSIRHDDRSNSCIAKEYGVDRKTIWLIKNGVTWKHVN